MRGEADSGGETIVSEYITKQDSYKSQEDKHPPTAALVLAALGGTTNDELAGHAGVHPRTLVAHMVHPHYLHGRVAFQG